MKRRLFTSLFVLLLGSLIITSGCSSVGNALPVSGETEQSESTSLSSAESSEKIILLSEEERESSDPASEESKAAKTGTGSKPRIESAVSSSPESIDAISSEDEPAVLSEVSIESVTVPESSQEYVEVSEPSVPESHEVYVPESSEDLPPVIIPESSLIQPESSTATVVSKPESSKAATVSKPESSKAPTVSKPETSTAPTVSKPENSTPTTVSEPESSTSVTQTSTISDTSVLAGKKLGAIGDSVVYGHQERGFAELIAADNGMTLQNRSKNGATIARDIPYKGDPEKYRKCIPDMAEKLDNDCDLIVTDGGYNDFVNDVPLGEMTRDGEEPDPYTFYGGLERLCRTLTEKAPKYGSLFVITHRVKHSDNSLGLSFGAYRYAILRVCGKYGISVLDIYAGEPTQLYYENNKTEGIYTQLGQGNIHPTEKGYREYYLPRIEERFCLMIRNCS